MSEMDFDGVWDRGAFETDEPTNRERYAKVMRTVLRSSASYVVEIADMASGGPPFNIPVEEIQNLFGLKNKPKLFYYEDPPVGLKRVGVRRMTYFHFEKRVIGNNIQ